MKFGYARVSREDQHLEHQVDALVQYGVKKENIYTDKKSGKDTNREGLQAVLNVLREGDELVIYKIGRLTRSVADFVKLRESLKAEGIKLTVTSIQLNMDSPTGKFFATMLAAFAEFERDQISERTKAALAYKRKQGIVPGRKPGYSILSKKQKEDMLKDYAENLELSVQEVADKYHVSRQTLNNLRKEAGLPQRKSGRPWHKSIDPK